MINWDKHPLPDRYRHHVSPNMYLPLKDLKITPDGYPPVPKKLDWDERYNNGEPPKYLDIGCGFGRHLMEFANSFTDDNVLGIEIRKQCTDYISSVIQKEELGNCSIIQYSVVNGLQFIDDNSIKKVFYFFPDPWFKKRHQKRRAFDLDFLNNVYRVLEKGGELLLQTDILDVHEYHKNILDEYGKFSYTEYDHNTKWDLPRTVKQTECDNKGFDYYKIKAIK